MQRTGFFSDKNADDLTDTQKLGMSKGYTLDQVRAPWFTFDHVWILTKGFKLEDIAGLSHLQVTGLEKGLTLTQIKELSDGQLQGISIDLTFEQVNHSWFTSSHAAAVMEGINYNEIKNLPVQKVEEKRAEMQKIEQDGASFASQYEEAMKDFSSSQKQK